jgi:hypothetical protein
MCIRKIVLYMVFDGTHSYCDTLIFIDLFKVGGSNLVGVMKIS